MSRRKIWSKSEKLLILDYASKHGTARASREHGISETSIYKWRDRFEKDGEDGLKAKTKSDHNVELRQLQRENRELKAIVAEKELQLRIQAEMLKKSH